MKAVLRGKFKARHTFLKNLEKERFEEMEGQGVQVIGIVLDIAGNADEETIEKAKLLAEKTGASTATISRVNRSLNYGNDGYDMVFSRIQEQKTDAGA